MTPLRDDALKGEKSITSLKDMYYYYGVSPNPPSLKKNSGKIDKVNNP